MANKLTLNQPDDERLTILVNGDEVGSVNHDQHGWAGMEAAEKLARRIAAKLGIEVEETFDDETCG